MTARGRVAYRVSFARGVLALALGAAMVVQPEKTSDNLATYMGAFWALTVDDVVAQSVLFSLLGIVILLTGLAHVLAGFRTGDELERQLSRSSILLGMMEIGLGLLFLLGSLENSRAAYLAAGIWALTGGVILIGDAILLRRQLRDQDTVQETGAVV